MLSRCIEQREALYTTNVAAYAALVIGRERWLLPLADANGTSRFVLGYNRPLSFKPELLAHVLDATGDIIFALEEIPAAAESESDCSVLSINSAAEAFFDRRRADIVAHDLSTLKP
jgi:hypothetical protein